VGVEDADGALDDEAVEIIRAEIGREGFAEAVEELEEAGLLEFNLLPRAPGLRETTAEGSVAKVEADAATDQQEERKKRPSHVANASRRDSDPASDTRVRL
jgi:hypothetical protein